MAPGSAKAREISSAPADREAHTQKYRYGAWYLPKSLWQRSLSNKELRDPKVVKAELDDTTRKREEEIVKTLHSLPFKSYLHHCLECSSGSVAWCQCVQRIFTRTEYSSITKSKFAR